MLRKRQTLATKRIVIASIGVLLLSLVSLLTGMVAILASPTQQVRSGITVTYLVEDVIGELRLRAYYKTTQDNSASWHTLTSNVADEFIELDSDSTGDPITATLVNIDIDAGLSYVLFECAFKNEGQNLTQLTFTENNITQNSNVIRTQKIYRNACDPTSVDDINDALTQYSSIAIAGTDDDNYLDGYVYYYVKVKIDDIYSNAQYAAHHLWRIANAPNVVDITLNNSSLGVNNTTIHAVEGALLPIQPNMARANYTSGGITTSSGSTGVQYIDDRGIPTRPLVASQLTNSTLYTKPKSIISVDNNGIMYINATSEEMNYYIANGYPSIKWLDIPQGAILPDEISRVQLSFFLTELERITVDEDHATYYLDGNCLINRTSHALELGFKNSVIPNDGSVTSINSLAFLNCKGLSSITIPNSVTTIGQMAFDGCSNLASVTFGENSQLTSIDTTAFGYCTSLTSITIPSGVTAINSTTFDHCSNLSNITFGESSQLASIGQYAFYYCTSLTNITIPSSVSSIGNYAFEGCYQLTEVINLSNLSITSITRIPLYSLIILDNENDKGTFSTSNGVIYYSNSNVSPVVAKTAVGLADTSLTSIVIDSDCTAISAAAFRSRSSLKTITIPASVTTIGSGAFTDSGLTSAEFEETSGWQVSSTSSSEGTAITLDTGATAANATKLKTTYNNKYWKRVTS